MKPVFDIELGQSSTDSKVLVNGVDISSAVQAVSVECVAGELTQVKFKCAPGAARARVLAEIKHVDVDGAAVIRPEEA